MDREQAAHTTAFAPESSTHVRREGGVHTVDFAQLKH